MRLSLSIIFVFIVFIDGTCNRESNKGVDKSLFYSIILKRLPSMPPPLPPETGDDAGEPVNKDFIQEKKIKVGMLSKTVVNFHISTPNFINEQKEYQEIFNSLINSTEPRSINFGKINLPDNRILIPLNDFKNLRDDVLWYVSFSDVFFNEKKTRALVYSTAHTSRKSGSYRLYLFEKKGNEWNIISTIIVGIS